MEQVTEEKKESMNKIIIKSGYLETVVANKRFNEATDKVKGPTGYKLFRILKKLHNEWEAYDKSRKKIVNMYAELDERGKPKTGSEENVVWKDGCLAKATEELTELRSIDITLNISPLDYNKKDMIDLSTNDLLILDPLMANDEN